MQLFTISILMCAGAVAGSWLIGVPLRFGLAVAVLGHVLLAYHVLYPAGSLFCPTLSYGRQPSRRCIALTFDDGPCVTITPEVLRILREKEVCATFFVIGRHARQIPELVLQIAHAGHEIANHSYAHPRHIYTWSGRNVLRDARLSQRILRRIIHVAPRLYRPPVGFRSPALAAAMRTLGLTLVTFSARAGDTDRSSAAAIVQRLVRNARPGAILLCHDGSDVNPFPDRRALLAALPIVIDRLHGLGYRFVTVSDLIDTVNPAKRA